MVRLIIFDLDLLFIEQSLDLLVTGFIEESGHLTLSLSFPEIDCKIFLFLSIHHLYLHFLQNRGYRRVLVLALSGIHIEPRGVRMR